MRQAVHFVGFKNLHDSHYRNAVRVWGLPDFLHQRWDRRSRREVAEGDTIVFADGEADQPYAQYNGDDEHYL